MSRAKRKTEPKDLGGLDSVEVRPVRSVDETRVLRATVELRRRFQDAVDAEKAARSAIRFASSVFHADEHALVIMKPGKETPEILASSGGTWDLPLIGRFVRRERSDASPDVVLARLCRRGRPWGAIALRWRRSEVGWVLRDGLRTFTQELNRLIDEIDRARAREVRYRLDRKIMEQLRSEDLFYHILDGLRSLTRYDHSATLLVYDPDDVNFALVAEKLAWRRGKSKRIGAVTELGADAFAELVARGVVGCRRTEHGWRTWDDDHPLPWLDALGALTVPGGRTDRPPAQEAIVAPAVSRDDVRAVLIVSTNHAGTFGPYEVNVLTSFVPYMTVALQNTQRAEALTARVVATERKHAMAELARGVAHDVNNALGSLIPLLEQVRHDVKEGTIERETLEEDLVVIDQSVQTCHRIFGGMLRFAREDARPGGQASVDVVTESALTILGEGLRRRGIKTDVRLEEGLPPLRIQPTQLERVFINIITNAHEALERGGRLTIEARRDEQDVVIEFIDDGPGIDDEGLAMIMEPFYTTKDTGNGLGLAICRTIIWQNHGHIAVESKVGDGTTVRMRLRAADGADAP